MGKWVVALMVGVALLVGHARVHASELNLMGYFENPWKNPKKEARAIIERRWAVSTDTWEAVYHPRDTIVPKLDFVHFCDPKGTQTALVVR
jgi:hypothetical protein